MPSTEACGLLGSVFSFSNITLYRSISAFGISRSNFGVLGTAACTGDAVTGEDCSCCFGYDRSASRRASIRAIFRETIGVRGMELGCCGVETLGLDCTRWKRPPSAFQDCFFFRASGVWGGVVAGVASHALPAPLRIVFVRNRSERQLTSPPSYFSSASVSVSRPPVMLTLTGERSIVAVQIDFSVCYLRFHSAALVGALQRFHLRPRICASETSSVSRAAFSRGSVGSSKPLQKIVGRRNTHGLSTFEWALEQWIYRVVVRHMKQREGVTRSNSWVDRLCRVERMRYCSTLGPARTLAASYLLVVEGQQCSWERDPRVFRCLET
ncbi:hypothetical protein KC335_g44 [Hortaea werneckii]|nr:hypothetical protein KC335_g44 [Hortaea werneckii]